MQNYQPPIFQTEEGMINMLLYTHLCHYRGGNFGETYSQISCHLLIYKLHVNGIVHILGEIFVQVNTFYAPMLTPSMPTRCGLAASLQQLHISALWQVTHLIHDGDIMVTCFMLFYMFIIYWLTIYPLTPLHKDAVISAGSQHPLRLVRPWLDRFSAFTQLV